MLETLWVYTFLYSQLSIFKIQRQFFDSKSSTESYFIKLSNTLLDFKSRYHISIATSQTYFTFYKMLTNFIVTSMYKLRGESFQQAFLKQKAKKFHEIAPYDTNY